jgi:hypothetical protein
MALPPAAFDITLDDASRLHGKPVVAKFAAVAPSFTWRGKTVTGAGERGDVAQTVVLSDERFIDVSDEVTLTGRLFVIRHPADMVSGQVVPKWVEIRI